MVRVVRLRYIHPMSITKISELWRYPIKSMQGESIKLSACGPRGLLGDRAYALRDAETGYLVTAKYPRRWGKVLQCSAKYVVEPSTTSTLPPVSITLPNGKTTRSDDDDCDSILSRYLERKVTLEKVPWQDVLRQADRSNITFSDSNIRVEPTALAAPDTFFDYAPLHLITVSSLLKLREIDPTGDLNVRRFRPNIVFSSVDLPGFVENSWIGKKLIVAGHGFIDVIDPTSRCLVPTLPQGDLLADNTILKAIAKNKVQSFTAAPGVEILSVVGVYAKCNGSFELSVGDVLEKYEFLRVLQSPLADH